MFGLHFIRADGATATAEVDVTDRPFMREGRCGSIVFFPRIAFLSTQTFVLVTALAWRKIPYLPVLLILTLGSY